ncbi:Tyrosine aminotransferase [Galdieria sulphuraria]|nr:Tyrosine aminotransferase [Galdieria sulphuraria]
MSYDDKANTFMVQGSSRTSPEDNGVRKYVEKVSSVSGVSKSVIALAGGDPTGLENVYPPTVVRDKLVEVIHSSNYNSYCPSGGLPQARAAVARYYANHSSVPLKAEDVFICSGAAGALDLVFASLCNAGDSLLLPEPGFPLFRSIANALNIECRYYQLDPTNHFSIQLDSIRKAKNERTKAIVVNNPHNPCGHILSSDEMNAVVHVAKELRLPIIADEVYEEIILDEESKFISFLSFAHEISVLKISSISKLYVAPGWRIGWCVIGDKSDSLQDIRAVMKRLSMRLIFPCSLTQAVLPTMLENANLQRQQVTRLIRQNAFTFQSIIQSAHIQGLDVSIPEAGLFLFVKLDPNMLTTISDDVEFVDHLLQEQAVGVVPGQAFGIKNYIRIALTTSKSNMEQAAYRIIHFCKGKCA